MASSTHKQHLYDGGATSAPPPTPSIQSSLASGSDSAGEVLSKLLNRLPPALASPPKRRSPPATCTPPPIISFLDLQSSKELPQLGFFQLTDHPVPSKLAHSAESNSMSLFELTREQKQLLFPPNWPLGYDCDEENGDESFCFDSSESTQLEKFELTELKQSESTQLNSSELTGSDLSSLREFSCEMEKVGLEIVEWLSRVVGFENPVCDEPNRVCSLMWIYESGQGRVYPYIVGLEYQMRCQKYTVLGDSGRVMVSPQVDSIMVTLGDIAQVWSNGKLKKVRGRPVPTSGDHDCITMSLLVTLPTDSTVSPCLSMAAVVKDHMEKSKEDEARKDDGESEPKKLFYPFPFEDYAWRVYHERRGLSEDPLDRCRV